MHHLRNLKIANFLIGAYTVVIGLIFLLGFALPGWWVWWEEGELPGLWFILMGMVAFVLIGGTGLAHLFVGYLVGSGRGRLAQTGLAVMQIMSFPVGTAYGCYALYVCWVDEVSSRRFERMIKPPIS